MSNLQTFLDGTFIFRHIDPEIKKKVPGLMKRRDFPAGKSIYGEGDSPDGMYILLDGDVSLFRHNKALETNLELLKLSPGEVFGDLELVADSVRTTSARAATEVRCAWLSAEAFKQLSTRVPTFNLGVLQSIAGRMIQMQGLQQMPWVSTSDFRIERDVLDLIPTQICSEHKMVPLRLESNVLTVGFVNPLSMGALAAARNVAKGLEVQPVAISGDDYLSVEKTHLRAGFESIGGTNFGDPRQLEIENDGPAVGAPREVDGQEVIRTVNEILAEGVQRGASDIHLDQEEDRIKVRYRIDGVLHERERVVPATFGRSLFSRIKILARVDPTAKDEALDGRISLSYRKKPYNLRVATIPTKQGERATLRILDATASLLPISSLVLAPKLAESIEAMILKAQGLVVVSGPTGSGKTTTLYSLIKARIEKGSDVNFVTAEDPVEYRLGGISQVEIRGHLTFPGVLRAFLRQDPDVILIGETRDPETAAIATQASITGHLVITSLHANSAADCIVRLRDLGVESYLLGSALSGLIAQRLVRRNCGSCTEERPIPRQMYDSLCHAGVLTTEDDATASYGKGCSRCDKAGYLGRLGVYEIMPMTPSISGMIGQNVPLPQIREEALKAGMISLHQYGRFLLKHNYTSPNEIMRILA